MNYSLDVNNNNEVPKFHIPKMAAFKLGFVQIQVHISIGGVQSYDAYLLLANTAKLYDDEYKDEADLIKY